MWLLEVGLEWAGENGVFCVVAGVGDGGGLCRWMVAVGGAEGGWRGEVGCVGGVGRAVVGVSCEDGGLVGRVYGVGTVVFGSERTVLGVMELGGVCGSVGTMAAVPRVKPGGRSRSNSRRWNCRRF